MAQKSSCFTISAGENAFPFFGPKGPGLVNHMHDGLTTELERRFCARAAEETTEILSTTEKSLPGVLFPAEAKVCVDLTGKKAAA